MSAEAIASMMADLRAGRVLNHKNVHQEINLSALHVAHRAVVVDATPIYKHVMASPQEGRMIYEEHPEIAPPFQYFAICYQNNNDSVIVMAADAQEWPKPWPTDPSNEVDWDRVRWGVMVYFFLRVRAPDGRIATVGPIHVKRLAIYEDGSPADIGWVQIAPEYDLDKFSLALLVLLGALNFMACRNVELVEPKRSRAEARRLARTGVTVKSITVFPSSRSSAKRERGDTEGGVPLSVVRGHFANYGPEYGRGLLFGKLAGRFWISGHARGSAEHGEIKADYELAPE